MTYNVEVSIGFPSGVERALALAVADASVLFPNQMAAVGALAQAGYDKWISYASGKEVLPNGTTLKPWSGQYLRSIQLEQTDATSYSIFSDDPKAELIEEGRSAWDFHEVLKTSTKVRRSSKGNLYLIIPFRHGTPDTIVVGEYTGRAMPDDVYELMREKAKSFITGHFTEPQIHNPAEKVKRNTYDWGDRLTLRDLSDLGYDLEHNKTKRMVGMVRIDTSTEKKNSSLYLTFRTLSEGNKPGTWIMPERKGTFVAKAVHDWLTSKFDEIMNVAIELDVAHIKELAGV